MKRFKLWALDRLAALFMWLALHCECWGFGHQWHLGPNSAWCERCEDRITGAKARRLYEAKYGPYVTPLETPRKPMVVNVDPDCPPDLVYMLDMSQWARPRDGAILDRTGKMVYPACRPNYAERLNRN